MKKWMSLVLILFLISFFFLGCAGTSKGTRIRCPKCGSYFDSEQGAETLDWMRGK